ncbi:MAG: 4-(cytidine 5'-diphospho)-2-C-methyl-D-erythritol kinase, partial [Lachnospiraceae bacterium]|nr:4-(cytidine 5'-diphospho)-2-C-methyl-D-erythritol kinase [Lachnospiraceae bacterium]
DRQEIPAGADNLVYKAADLILQEYDVSGGVEIVLEKHIPVAAGMAGGSTDAAAVFHGLNQLFDLGMSLGEMQRLGVKIGADVPYCIMGGTALSEGIGEVLTPLEPPPACTLLVAKPDISVSTKFVYENLHADKLTRHPDIDGMIEAVREGNLAGITERMENVLETVTIKEYPVIQKIKKAMTGKGAENALMSGSGPTVFGIFKEENTARETEKEIKKQGLASQVFVTAFYP